MLVYLEQKIMTIVVIKIADLEKVKVLFAGRQNGCSCFCPASYFIYFFSHHGRLIQNFWTYMFTVTRTLHVAITASL